MWLYGWHWSTEYSEHTLQRHPHNQHFAHSEIHTDFFQNGGSICLMKMAEVFYLLIKSHINSKMQKINDS